MKNMHVKDAMSIERKKRKEKKRKERKKKENLRCRELVVRRLYCSARDNQTSVLLAVATTNVLYTVVFFTD